MRPRSRTLFFSCSTSHHHQHPFFFLFLLLLPVTHSSTPSRSPAAAAPRLHFLRCSTRASCFSLPSTFSIFPLSRLPSQLQRCRKIESLIIISLLLPSSSSSSSSSTTTEWEGCHLQLTFSPSTFLFRLLNEKMRLICFFSFGLDGSRSTARSAWR